MYANVTIRAEVPNALTLPAEAVAESILDTGARNYCFAVVEGKAVRLPVEVGIRTQKLVQVLQKQVRSGKSGKEVAWENLTGAESIVASNPTSLLDGQAVVVESRTKDQVTEK